MAVRGSSDENIYMASQKFPDSYEKIEKGKITGEGPIPSTGVAELPSNVFSIERSPPKPMTWAKIALSGLKAFSRVQTDRKIRDAKPPTFTDFENSVLKGNKLMDDLSNATNDAQEYPMTKKEAEEKLHQLTTIAKNLPPSQAKREFESFIAEFREDNLLLE